MSDKLWQVRIDTLAWHVMTGVHKAGLNCTRDPDIIVEQKPNERVLTLTVKVRVQE